jgi:hypothetical protein
MTNEQTVVVESRIARGYQNVGKSNSLLNGLPVYLLQKGKHFMAINTLGYDEHLVGLTWKVVNE